MIGCDPTAKDPQAQVLDQCDPPRLLKRSDVDVELGNQPIIFWKALLYQAWSLVAIRGEFLLYSNHAFGRRSVGLWKTPITASMFHVGS